MEDYSETLLLMSEDLFVVKEDQCTQVFTARETKSVSLSQPLFPFEISAISPQSCFDQQKYDIISIRFSKDSGLPVLNSNGF